MYYDEYTSYASGTLLGYARPIESPIVNAAMTGGTAGTGYRYQPILVEPGAPKIPTACHTAGVACTSFSPDIISFSTYWAIDIVDANNVRLFKKHPSGSGSDVIDTGYIWPISGAIENYGASIPRCSCGNIGAGPVSWSAPSFGCEPTGSPDPISLPDTAPYCVDVEHVGGPYFSTDTPTPWNSTYAVLLLKRVAAVTGGSLVLTGTACGCDVSMAGEDCVARHPVKAGNEIITMDPIPFPYTSSTVISPLDFNFDPLP